MTKKLFRRIFRKPGAEPLERSYPAGELARAADRQPELFGEPSNFAIAPPSPDSDAASAPQRDLPSYISAAVGLRDAGRFDEAEKLLVEAVERFPTQPRPQIELAVVSHARRDWPEAVQRWEIVRAEFPNEPLSYTLAAAALREAGRFDEAEALAASARERFPDDFLALLEHARAGERRDQEQGPEGWRELRDRFPDRIEGYAGLAAVFRKIGRLDEADAVLAQGVERFPESRQLALEFARAAEARRDWAGALDRWSAIRNAFPDEVWGYIGRAAALRELRRTEEAEAILAEAVERFPAEPRLHMDRALLAHHRGDWQETAARWAEVRAQFPDQTIAIWHGAAALSRLQKHEEAEALLAEGLGRFPKDLGIATESAWLATHRRDWAEALRRWQSVRDAFPDNPRGYTGTAMVQRELGWLGEAETTLAEAIERFPRDLAAQIDYARLAETRRDRAEALRRWQALRDAFPDQAAGYTGAAALLRDARRFEEAEALLADAAVRFPDDPRLDIERAVLAHNRRDWAEAAYRWEKTRVRLPDERSGYLLGAAALREQKRFDDAESVLSAALERFPADAALHIEFALLAEARLEWAQAAESWAALRIAFPQDVRGFTFGARALRQLGRTEEADDLLAEAMNQFPNDVAAAVGHAAIADYRRDWDEAVLRWRLVRERFPTEISGYLNGARSCQIAGRADESASVLAEAESRWPGNRDVLSTRSALAFEAGDPGLSLAFGQELLRLFPADANGFFYTARALCGLGRASEAEQLLADAPTRFPENAAILSLWASLAIGQEQSHEAVRRWRRLEELFPDEPKFRWQCANSLSRVRRFDEAEQLLKEGLSRFPDSSEMAAELAWVAFHQHRWPEAEARFADVLVRFPEAPVGYTGSAALHRVQGRFDEAEAVLEAGIARLPQNPDIAREYARLPLMREHHIKKDWDKAFSRLESLRKSFPSYEPGWLDSIRHAREAERFEMAEELAVAAVEKFANSAQIAVQWATAALDRRDYEEAVIRFETVLERFDHHEPAYIGIADALTRAGRHGEADRILREAQARFPHSSEIACAYARMATLRLDWKEAFERLNEAQRQFPHDREVSRQLFAARLRLTETEDFGGAEIADRQLRVVTGPAENGSGFGSGSAPLPPQELVEHFESLGGTAKGCEFGLLQREFGAEPLGLLRWTDVGPEDLIAALEARFEGVGLAENTELTAMSAGGPLEWSTSDRRFGMRMHTFAAAASVPREQMFRQVCRRLQFLRDKLIADLQAGSKIFVYKITTRNLSDEELAALHRAMRDYGDNTLLYLRYAEPDQAPGTVHMVQPGLMVGYIDRFWVDRDGNSIGPVTQSWLAICQNAYALWLSQRSAGTPPTSSADNGAGESSSGIGFPAAELVMNFESLGGSGHGCEFGIFQREFGAEPLGLLRWADLGHEALAEALETGFEGVGLAEQTELFVPPSTGRGEYWTRDKRYWMAMRTFVPIDEIAEDKMFERVCRRLQFLKRKLIEDLAGASKIFVYKAIARNLTDAEIGRIHRAMRRYGDNTLLYVGYADADHPAGTVELAKPGLILGYIERFAFSPDDTNLGPATDGWLAICRSAYKMWQSRAGIPAAVSSSKQLEPLTV